MHETDNCVYFTDYDREGIFYTIVSYTQGRDHRLKLLTWVADNCSSTGRLYPQQHVAYMLSVPQAVVFYLGRQRDLTLLLLAWSDCIAQIRECNNFMPNKREKPLRFKFVPNTPLEAAMVIPNRQGQ